MHRCAARCCEDQTSSIERVQQCVERCSAPLNNAQAYVQKEIDHTQQRLQRCIMECNDDIKDKMGPSPTDSDVCISISIYNCFEEFYFNWLHAQQFAINGKCVP